jgi:hypothetical protein
VSNRERRIRETSGDADAENDPAEGRSGTIGRI